MGPRAKEAIPAVLAVLKDKDLFNKRKPNDTTEFDLMDRCGDAADALMTLVTESKEAVAALNKALRSKEPRRVGPIAMAIAKHGPKGKELVPALVDALKDIKGFRDIDIRFRVAHALEKIGPDAKSALPDLIALIKEDAKQFPMAVFAIRGMGPDGKEAMPALIDVLFRPDFKIGLTHVHEVTVEILVRLEAKPTDILKACGKFMKTTDAPRNSFGASRTVQQVLERLKGGSDALTAALKEKDAEIVLGAVTVLLHTRSAGSMTALCDLLPKHDDADIRLGVAGALQQYREGPKEVVMALRDALRDPDKRVRGQSATSLGIMGKAATMAIVELGELRELQDKNPGQGNAATRALHQIRGKTSRGVPALIETLTKEDSPRARFEAAFDLSQHGPQAKEALPALVQALQDKDADVPAAAAFALGAIGPDAKAALPRLRELVKDTDARVSRLVQNALTRIDPDLVKK